jgi:hypothetical protein
VPKAVVYPGVVVDENNLAATKVVAQLQHAFFEAQGQTVAASGLAVPTRPQEQTSRGLGPEPDVDIQLVAHDPSKKLIMISKIITEVDGKYYGNTSFQKNGIFKV